MWLPRGHQDLQVVEAAWDLEQLGQDHGSQMPATNYSNLKWRHLIQQLHWVLHDVGGWLLHARWAASLGRAPIVLAVCSLLALLITDAFTSLSAHLLAFLQQKGLLVEDQVIEHTCKEDAFKHDQVADDFTGQESVLQFLVLDEIVKPLLSESWHSAHLEEIGGLKPWHLRAARLSQCNVSSSLQGCLIERCSCSCYVLGGVLLYTGVASLGLRVVALGLVRVVWLVTCGLVLTTMATLLETSNRKQMRRTGKNEDLALTWVSFGWFY